MFSFLAMILALILLSAFVYGLTDHFLRKHRLSNVAHVIVLGKIDQSPRTLEHSRALVMHMQFDVVIAGHGPFRSVDERSLRVYELSLSPPSWCRAESIKSRLVKYACKIVWDSVQLLLFFCNELVPAVVIVQNPPALPLLPLAWLYCRMSGARLVVDWHNYGSTILALQVGDRSVLTQLYWICEVVVGMLADLNLCVSNEMMEDLLLSEVTASVFYDRPLEKFLQARQEPVGACLEDRSARLGQLQCTLSGARISGSIGPDDLVIVSSTSWTVDERIDMLVKALANIDSRLNCHVHCIVTGKGPERAQWEKRLADDALENVSIYLMWLPASQYPMALAMSDLGVCLHTSSSGLDLPMKVLDMVGAMLPVACFDYGICIREIPMSLGLPCEEKPDDVFQLFRDHVQLERLLLCASQSRQSLIGAKHRLSTIQISTWQQEWGDVVKPLVCSLLQCSDQWYEQH